MTHTQQPPAWVDDALCAQTDPEAFHPEKGANNAPAKAICAGCPVLAQCREYGINHPDLHGIWGGLTLRERQQIRRERGVQEPCAACGTEFTTTLSSRYCSTECRKTARREQKTASYRRRREAA